MTQPLLDRPVLDPLLPLATYVLLATGTLLPVEAMGGWAAMYLLVVVVFATAFLVRAEWGVVAQALGATVCVLGPIFVLYLISAARTWDMTITLRRIDGAVATTMVAVVLVAAYVARYGEQAFKAGFIRGALLILALTLVYKSIFGFFDRDGRFFINGPIVFGWLMGFCALTVLQGLIHGALRSVWLLGFACFLLAAIWTQSKGPLLSIFVTALFLLVVNLGKKRAVSMLGFFVLFACVLVVSLPEEFTRRFLAIFRVLLGATDESDYGSVGYRQDAWRDAYQMFMEHPLWGVGVGNWQFLSRVGEIQYPHNMFLEVGAEMGFPGISMMLATLGYLFLRSEGWGRLAVGYFCLCCSFSGDFSYFRFMVAIPLGLLVVDMWSRRRPGGAMTVHARA
jgi:O-antigen ligase